MLAFFIDIFTLSANTYKRISQDSQAKDIEITIYLSV